MLDSFRCRDSRPSWPPLRCAVLADATPGHPGLRCVAPSWRKKSGLPPLVSPLLKTNSVRETANKRRRCDKKNHESSLRASGFCNFDGSTVAASILCRAGACQYTFLRRLQKIRFEGMLGHEKSTQQGTR